MTSHYFTNDTSLKPNQKTFSYSFMGEGLTFTSDSGIFSHGHVDKATDILLNTIPPVRSESAVLDLGCGFGAIGISLSKAYKITNMIMSDVNPRATELAKINADKNGVRARIITCDGFDGIDEMFDVITLNPPIHAGKAVCYKLYEEAKAHLKDGGKFYIVIQKQHGAESTIKKLSEVFSECEVIYKKKGFFVIACG